MNTTTIKSILCGVAASFAAAVLAAVPSSITKFVPEMMNYQGYLANPSTGVAYTDGIYQLECRLYRTASSGTAIWGGRYSVYVKDGYFNIMLGDPAAVNLGHTYANTDLWKALWYDTAVSEKHNLWLGVNPLQGPTGANLTSPTEISPRQQLLAAPYAFRAQAAEYAEQSIGNFKVNGSLNVTGSLALPSSFQFGHIKDTSTQLTLGGTSNASSNPYIYGYASYMNLYAYNTMNFSTTSGGYNFTVPSGKSFVIKSAGNFAVTNTTTTMKSSGTTSLAAGTSLSLSGGTTATLSAGSSITLSPATNAYVYGKGTVRWTAPGTNTQGPAMELLKYTITVPAGTNSKAYTIGKNPAYVYMIAGIYHTTYTVEGNALFGLHVSKDSSGSWSINVRYEKNLAYSRTVTVHILKINSGLVHDAR